jgi:GT2 family glycosyltransferase
MKSVCLAILNYNGVQHLEHLLPSLPAGAEGFHGTLKPVVLDNRSSKGDEAWVRANHPEVEFVTAPGNEFMYSYNWLASQRSEDIFILINNDTRLTPGFIAQITRHFPSDDLFSVCAHSLSWEGTEDTCGPARLTRQHGFYRWAYDMKRQQLCHTLYSSSGFMAVDRKKFLELGGFSRLYFPMYCDDLDLGFRAWRRGWRSIYDPDSVLYHRENGSGASDWVQRHDLRNSLLFEWSSLPIEAFASQRGLRLANLIGRELLSGRRFWFPVWKEARKRWAEERSRYADTKISETEYQQLCHNLELPVPPPPNPS